jgi:hypothetical protein
MAGGPSAATAARKRALKAEMTDSATPRNIGSKAKRANPAARQAQLLLNMQKKDWEEIEEHAEHVADVVGLMYHGQITAAGTFNMQLGCPLEYAHDGVDISIAAKSGMLYFRVYVVSPETMMPEEADLEDVDDNGYGGDDWELGDD